MSKATFDYLRRFTWRRVLLWIRRKHRRANWRWIRRRYLSLDALARARATAADPAASPPGWPGTFEQSPILDTD